MPGWRSRACLTCRFGPARRRTFSSASGRGQRYERQQLMADITLTINGATRTGSPEARKTLADFLRDDLGLTGTHLGCEHGVCGACTVIVDGRAVRSCRGR